MQRSGCQADGGILYPIQNFITRDNLHVACHGIGWYVKEAVKYHAADSPFVSVVCLHLMGWHFQPKLSVFHQETGMDVSGSPFPINGVIAVAFDDFLRL